jgi:hypothetical protein
MIAIREALETISQSPWTAVVLSSGGEIEELVPVGGHVTSDDLLEFIRKRAHGRRFRLVEQADLSEAELAALISDVTGSSDCPRNPDPRRLDASVTDLKLRLHPFAPAQAIADAIVKWVMRR